MIIQNFFPYSGTNYSNSNCELIVVCNLVYNQGIKISEPLLFGIGQGLGYIYWKMKTMDFPFIGGRCKQDDLTTHICENLGFTLDRKETSSVNKAWQNVAECIDNGIPVGLKLDCYHLDYFTEKVHFAGHYITIYGYDETDAYVVDAVQQNGTQKVNLKNLELARNERGPMSSRNLSFTIACKTSKLPDLEPVIINAIKANAAEFLNPPISNIGYKGIIKTSKEAKKWFEISNNIEHDLPWAATMMDMGGTSGNLFRNYYRDFLKESYNLAGRPEIEQGYTLFSESADKWGQVIALMKEAGATKNKTCLVEISDVLLSIADIEKKAMEILQTL